MDRMLDSDTLKRKLRALKKFEIKTRFQGVLPKYVHLVFNELFSDKINLKQQVKYPFDTLLALTKDAKKVVFDTFFSMVYYQYYEENGFPMDISYDVRQLSALSLPFDATQNDIKQKFRVLAKKYHPDLGGDAAKFVELMNIYNGLLEK